MADGPRSPLQASMYVIALVSDTSLTLVDLIEDAEMGELTFYELSAVRVEADDDELAEQPPERVAAEDDIAPTHLLQTATRAERSDGGYGPPGTGHRVRKQGGGHGDDPLHPAVDRGRKSESVRFAPDDAHDEARRPRVCAPKSG